MEESCIVCLGDLASGGSGFRRSSLVAPLGEGGTAAVTSAGLEDAHSAAQHAVHNIKHEQDADPILDTLDSATVIAHLLPCGHNLHNECLKPWVERCNSCPCCRTNFNVVELKARINGMHAADMLRDLANQNVTGPTLDTYAVQDKKQVADIDPSMIVDDDLYDEPNIEPCIFCEQYGNDDVLLLCDGCNASCHTYCTGLGGVPAGPWFCQFCAEDQILDNTAPARSAVRGRRGRSGRQNSRSDASGEAWARVWQTVWDRLNFDLDFPFDDEAELAQRTDAQRRDFQQWQRRFHIAERLGGAARFRDTATAILDRPAPSAESQEELRAWNAFDKAKELQETEVTSTTTASPRKRKSTPASPADPAPEPERRLKRPRTRRTLDATDASSDAGAESSNSTRRMTEHSISTPSANARLDTVPAASAGPSFFQSLLKEVENTPSTEQTRRNKRLNLDIPTPGDYTSTGPGSPASSPTTSNHPSPRLRPSSPPPNHHSRPSSPPPLTSRIEPVYAMPSQAHSPSSRIAVQSDSEDMPTDGETR